MCAGNGVLLWTEREVRFSLIWPVRNLHMEIPSPFPLLINTGSRKWSSGIQGTLQKFLLYLWHFAARK